VTWGAVVEGTARELLDSAEVTQDDPEEKSALQAAKDFLTEILSSGLMTKKEVEYDAKVIGIIL
jgi:hypothetical protein